LAWASGAAAARTRSTSSAPRTARENIPNRCTVARLRRIDACHLRRARPARRLIAALVAVTAFSIAIPAAAQATPFVVVDATLKRTDGGALVTGEVRWDGPAATREPDFMTEGDLRLVAVSDHGHRPTVLATVPYREIATDPTQPVLLHIREADEHAIAAGNRVVLTASQHGALSPGTRTVRTYVTVDQLQPFGTKQDRIGRRDCADVAIVPGADLNECDLTGADLDRALVSVRDPAGTRMLLADLTGATMRGADLTGLSVAGGRLNGAEATDAILDNLSLAGAEATGLVARDATSDRRAEAAGANIFDARLTDADFRGAVLNGVSLNHSDLDGADFQGATWNAMQADTASFRGADLRGLQGEGASVAFADFTDAELGGSSLTETALEWATLCHTELPDGVPEALADRDCRTRTDPGPKPVDDPFVVVDASLRRAAGTATIKATVDWNEGGTGSGLSAGDIRVVAIDRATGLPTEIGSESIADDLPATTAYERTITAADPKLLATLADGNRVVVTATQHPPLPGRARDRTAESYVTVDTVQAGPGPGRVGSRDCSDLRLTATEPPVGGYDFCDLAGAALTRADLSGPMREADLSGAELRGARLNGIDFDGAALAGADLERAQFDGAKLIAAFAPRLTMREASVNGSLLRASDLDQADFDRAALGDTTLAASSLRRATFSDATFDHVDLGYARLSGARLDGVEAESPDRRHGPSSLFLADLRNATLAGSHWEDDEAGERPWRWATLCDTVLPAGAAISGDRDCPRSPAPR
jgi:uncharacterized protein YjbI with pentapeptide repeats